MPKRWCGTARASRSRPAWRSSTATCKTGGELWERGMEEMDRAVCARARQRRRADSARRHAAAGHAQHAAGHGAPAARKGVGDYEHVLALQSSYFATLGDHPKGELLFGLAEGYSRLGQLGEGADVLRSADRPMRRRQDRRRRRKHGWRRDRCRQRRGSAASAAISNEQATPTAAYWRRILLAQRRRGASSSYSHSAASRLADACVDCSRVQRSRSSSRAASGRCLAIVMPLARTADLVPACASRSTGSPRWS